MAGKEAAGRIAELLEAPGPLAAPSVEVGGPGGPLGTEPVEVPRRGRPPAIAFEDVRFAYDAARGPALDGFSLALPAGATVALVGPSGAGKTTVAHLLLRFLEPGRGAITVDGTPLAALAPEEWRRRVAWVPQRPRLFHGTVRENVALARPGASDAELAEAAARARLDVALRALPRGWRRPWERAASGSPGERPRGWPSLARS